MLGCGFAAAMWLGTRGRWFLLSVVTVGTVLTLSRTTLAALAAGLVWVAVARGRGRLAGVGAAAALMGVVAWLESNVSRVGPFQGRSGSDDLRRAIDLASQFKASIRPWIGLGPGTAQVEARSEQFFFHSSYLAVRTEGGWLTLLRRPGAVRRRGPGRDGCPAPQCGLGRRRHARRPGLRGLAR